MDQAFQQGITAYRDGLFLHANPYTWATSPHLHTAWNDGWLSVRDVRTVIELSLAKKQ